jgi:hypothetical protein
VWIGRNSPSWRQFRPRSTHNEVCLSKGPYVLIEAGVLGALVAGDPARPLFTYYDDATGERTELSAVTLGNWIAKTANLLVDGCGLGPGDRVAVLLPPHWQTAAVLLGAWSAGLSVALPGTAADSPPGSPPAVDSPPGSPPAVDSPPTPGTGVADVVFAALDRLAAAPPAGDRFALGLAPMGLPLRDVPAGWLDYVAEARGHGDQFRAAPPPDAAGYRAAVAAARELAAALGLRPGDRVLVDAGAYPDPPHWLLAPLVAGASVVLCAHQDPGAVASRVAAERVTRLL